MKTTIGLDKKYCRLQFYLKTCCGTLSKASAFSRKITITDLPVLRTWMIAFRKSLMKAAQDFVQRKPLSKVDKPMFQRIGHKTILNPTFHYFWDYKGAVGWTAIWEVTACALLVNGNNNRIFPFWREGAVIIGQVEDVCHKNWDIAPTQREGSWR